MILKRFIPLMLLTIILAGCGGGGGGGDTPSGGGGGGSGGGGPLGGGDTTPPDPTPEPPDTTVKPIPFIEPGLEQTIQTQGGTAVIILFGEETLKKKGLDFQSQNFKSADSKQRFISARRKDTLALQEEFLALLDETDFTITQRFTLTAGIAGILTPSGMEKLKTMDMVDSVAFDKMLTTDTNQSIPLVQADQLSALSFNGFAINGYGEAVVVIDTGIDYNHPALGGGSGPGFKVIDGWQFYPTFGGNFMDDQGHGTHVSGIIASTDATYRGVAPGAWLIGLKACDNSFPAVCSESAVVQAMDWTISHSYYGIAAINMSLGGGAYGSNCEGALFPISTKVTEARAIGIVTVVASGNSGSSTGIAYPACATNALSVGATTKADVITGYTQTASILDVLAPGDNITSTLYGAFGSSSGTSMAAPHVAGATALLAEYQLRGEGAGSPNPAAIETALKTTGLLLTDPDNGLSFPRIRILEAYKSLDTVAPTIAYQPPTPTSGTITSSSSVTVTISSNESLNNATIDWNGTPEAMSGGGTSWSITKSGLSSATYTYFVTGTDFAGHSSLLPTRTITVDSLAPSISFTSPTPLTGASQGETWVYITATSNKALLSVTLEWDGVNESMSGSDALWYINKSALTPGVTYTYRVFGVDAGGQTATTESRTMSITLPACSASDLDNDTVGDSCDPETLLSATQSLPAGTYHFLTLRIASGVTITAQSDSSLSGFKGVEIIAESVIIDGTLSADARGYGPATGPGAGTTAIGGGSGAGHGGRGGASTSSGGPSYSSATNPIELGSGGGNSVSGIAPRSGGSGGGAIRLTVNGTLTVNGLITANGVIGGSRSDQIDAAGGGSGGSIQIMAGLFTGTGTLRANGGAGGTTVLSGWGGGGGSGGRIMVNYTTTSFSGTVLVSGGAGGTSQNSARRGSAGADGTAILSTYVSGLANAGSPTGTATVTGNHTPADGETFVFNNLIMENGSTITIQSGFTVVIKAASFDQRAGAALSLSDGAQLTVTGTGAADLIFSGTVAMLPGSTLTLNGTTISFPGSLAGSGAATVSINELTGIAGTFNLSGSMVAQRITITTTTAILDGTLSTDGHGYPSASGPGAGSSAIGGGAGAGYGGAGGASTRSGGVAYGIATAPIDLGSGGGGSFSGIAPRSGGWGGGAIRLTVSGSTAVNGLVTANGSAGGARSDQADAAGGGSGGSLFITTGSFSGSGTVRADGGAGGTATSWGGGGGGGGRVAIFYSGTTFSGTMTANGGAGGGGASGKSGQPGVIGSITY